MYEGEEEDRYKRAFVDECQGINRAARNEELKRGYTRAKVRYRKGATMDDKNLLEDDIIDLTDLLEEGSPPKKPQQANTRKRVVNEPDSFDLGKEISMDYDVSIEEIENDSTVLAKDTTLDFNKKPQKQSKAEDDMSDLLKEPLGSIESEIDHAMKDKFEEVSLTAKEEEVLLSEGPAEEVSSIKNEESAALIEELPAPPEEPVRLQEVSIPAFTPSPIQEPPSAQVEMPKVGIPVNVPTEAILEAVITEFRKEMPAFLEGIIRPVMKELIQEIISSTREVIPGIVEKVIREEIEKLKKL
jgi:hypothetical protein